MVKTIRHAHTCVECGYKMYGCADVTEVGGEVEFRHIECADSVTIVEFTKNQKEIVSALLDKVILEKREFLAKWHSPALNNQEIALDCQAAQRFLGQLQDIFILVNAEGTKGS